jgi:hypothetical protein
MTHRRALMWGAVAAASWIALAAVSASLSPLARRPLLDGFVTGVDYRWADPPPALAPTNVPPSGAEFDLTFREGASEADVVFTPDNQVTVVAPEGVVADDRARTLRLAITPHAPSTVASLPGDLEPFGNVIEIAAATTPDGEVQTFDAPLTVVLVYPATPNLHATDHELLWSPDGTTWTRLDTTDSIGAQQAQGEIDGPGFVVVGGVPTAAPTGSDVADGASTNPLSTILLIVAGASLLIGIGLLVRARNPRA